MLRARQIRSRRRDISKRPIENRCISPINSRNTFENPFDGDARYVQRTRVFSTNLALSVKCRRMAGVACVDRALKARNSRLYRDSPDRIEHLTIHVRICRAEKYQRQALHSAGMEFRRDRGVPFSQKFKIQPSLLSSFRASKRAHRAYAHRATIVRV